ncbi:MAG: hypothetical protein IE890_00880 [Arcobacter sp.]|nr:hypothetical protein [Arcobacter sp.]
MERTNLNVSNFERVGTGNILGLLSPAYRFVCPESFVYQVLSNQPALMKITTGETKTNVNTAVDFDVIASYSGAVYKNQNNETVYEKMAVAYDHTTQTISKAVAFDTATNTFTFSALSGGGVHTVSIFYLLGEGDIRFQLVGSGSNIVSNRGIFEGSIELLNSKQQTNSEEILYINEPVEISDAMSLEIAANSSAPIILNSKDLVPAMPSNIAPSVLRIPVNYTRATDVTNPDIANKQLSV